MKELIEQAHHQYEQLKPKAQAFIQAEIFMQSSKSASLTRKLQEVRGSLMMELHISDLAQAILVKDRMDQERGRN